MLSYPFLPPQRNNAQVIADSILTLQKNRLISSPEDDPHVSSELKAQGATLESSSVDRTQSVELSTGGCGLLYNVHVVCSIILIRKMENNMFKTLAVTWQNSRVS